LTACRLGSDRDWILRWVAPDKPRAFRQSPRILGFVSKLVFVVK
jgi:hypothetical protein